MHFLACSWEKAIKKVIRKKITLNKFKSYLLQPSPFHLTALHLLVVQLKNCRFIPDFSIPLTHSLIPYLIHYEIPLGLYSEFIQNPSTFFSPLLLSRASYNLSLELLGQSLNSYSYFNLCPLTFYSFFF